MQTFLRTVAKVVGSEVIDDVVAFFRAFEGMEAGFRERALAVEQLLADAVDRVRARHVAAPRRDGGGRVLRRAARRPRPGGRRARSSTACIPTFGDEAPAGLRARAACAASRCSRGRRRRERGSRRSTTTSPTSARSPSSNASTSTGCANGSAPRRSSYVPYLARDVYDFDALHEIGQVLLGDRDGERASVTAMDDDPRGRRREVGTRPGPRRVRRPGPAGRRGDARPGRPRHGRSAKRPTSSSSTSRSATWVASRPRSTCGSRSRAADSPHATILLLLDRDADKFLGRRADVDADAREAGRRRRAAPGREAAARTRSRS